MVNYYRGTAEHPFHLSVGVVLINGENKVACHYFKEFQADTDLEKVRDVYILMRETLEPGESLEVAALRGIKEEFGAEGEIIDYVGSIKSHFRRVETPVEKNTLYFLIKVGKYDQALRKSDDEEGSTDMQWQSIDFLIEKMKEQGRRYQRTDLDESNILERIKRVHME